MQQRAYRQAWPLAALLILAIGAPASAGQGAQGQTAPPPGKPSIVEGAVAIAAATDDNTGNQDVVGRYDRLTSGTLPNVSGQLWGQSGTTRFEAYGWNGGEVHYQQYRGAVDFSRILTAEVSYVRFPRRLRHDPLSYLDSASGIGGTFVLRHDDTDPTAEYGFDHAELKARVELQTPAAPWLKLFASHRQEIRDGFHQSLATSHCSNCHTTSYTRGIDEKTRDLSAGALVRSSRVSVDYTYLHRTFRDDAAGLTNTYDLAVHPASLADVFLNRVQYDQRDGALAFDTTPSMRKTSHVINARVALPADASFSGTFARTEVTNTDTDLGTTYTGASGRFVVPIGTRLTARGSLRHYDINADSVFVEVAELVAPAGPAAGLTYEQAYPAVGDLSFLRESSLSRSPTDFSLALTVQAAKRTTFDVEYAYESLTREHDEVEKTTTSTLAVSGRGRPAKPVQWRFRFDHDWITDPFLYEHAAIPQVLQPYPSPNSVPFTGLQYFEMYDSRQADLTNYPTRRTFADGSISWTPNPRVSLSGHLRGHRASNDDLNFSTWDRTSVVPGAEIWVAPDERFSLMAGYTYQRERLDTLFSTLAFSG